MFFIFSFPEFEFPYPFRRNLYLNHHKAHLILSSFILSHHSFVTGVLHDGSSWFNSVFKCSSRFCWWSFFIFFWSGVLHFFVLLSYPIISVCGRLSPHNFEMFSISPQQVYSFVVNFLNNSVQSFLLSSFHSTLSILPEALHCSSRQVSFNPL